MPNSFAFRNCCVTSAVSGFLVTPSIYQTGKAQAWSDLSKPIILSVHTSDSLLYNHSVGRDWWAGAAINNEEIDIGKDYTIEVGKDDDIRLIAAAEEMDNIPDRGFNQENVFVRDLNFRKSNEISFEVPVTENRGRYSGNNALWEFTFTIQREVTFTDVIAQIFDR